MSVPNFSSLARLEVPEKCVWWVVGCAKSFSFQTQPLCCVVLGLGFWQYVLLITVKGKNSTFYVPKAIKNFECWTGDGFDFRGSFSTVKYTGLGCQKWSKQEPHTHQWGHLGDHNHCRNPDADPGGPWCYVDSKALRWDHCHGQQCYPCDDGNLKEILSFARLSFSWIYIWV